MEYLYKAFDGTIFEDEEKCSVYERDEQLSIFQGKVVLLDVDKQVLPFNRGDAAWYLGIDDTEILNSLPLIDDLATYEENLPSEKGEFWYENGTDTWHNIDDTIAELTDQIAEWRKLKNQIKEKLKGE